MEPLTREDFWKNAANRLEILLKSPKRHKYEEDLSSTAVLTPPPDRIKLKTSIMGRTYKNHDPLFSKVTERALNYQQIHSNHGPLREISPKNSNRILKNENPQKDAKSKHEGIFKRTLHISGQKAKIALPPLKAIKIRDITPHRKMPSMLLNIQNFLSEVKKKYDKLHKKISENDRITKENLVDYLGRIMSRGAHTNHRINSGTCELRGATPWRAENTNSKHIRLPIVTESPELNPVVQDKASILLDIFDAFELGFISRHSFFGVMIVHEYTSYGVMRSRLPISKLNFQDNKQLNQLKNQVLQFKEVFGQYCQGKVMSRDAFKSLLDAICEKEEVNEVMDMFEIRDGVSFGQFLSSIPFLLEHYDKFSVKISNDANI